MSRQFDLGRVQGRDFAILGRYDTLEDLEEARPEPEVGEVYEVGTEPPYEAYVYTFNDTTKEYAWVQQGNLRGPQGEQGPTGPQGPQGPPGSAVIYIEDELDEHGGIIRHINGVNITYDTVTAEVLQQGYTAHNSQGELVVGTATFTQMWFGTRSEYNALTTIDPDVCYCIEEGT